MAASSAPPSATPLFKALASSSTTRRRQAMASIRTYLSSSRSFTHTDYLKIWKALFYCLYMTPKMRLQQRLSIDIAELVEVVASAGQKSSSQQAGKKSEGAEGAEDPEEVEADEEEEGGREETEDEKQRRREQSASFQSAFWETMAREWSGIDKARMDKFLFLVRRMVYTSILACRIEEQGQRGSADAQLSFSLSVLQSLASILKAVPFDARNAQIPVGLRLHVLDVLVDEIERADPDAVMRGEVVEVLLAPVRALKKDSLTKTVRIRAEETLTDERLAKWGVEGVKVTEKEVDGQGDGGDEEWDGFGD